MLQVQPSVNYYEIGYWLISVLILCATVFYIYYSPIKAVKIGRQLDDIKIKYLAKERLFLTLFAYRGSPINYQFVDGLNQIDIVFRDTPSVIASWHNHFRSLTNRSLSVDEDRLRQWEIERMELLSLMSEALGYGVFDITALMQHYYPKGHGELHDMEQNIREAALVFLRSGAAVNQLSMDLYGPQKESNTLLEKPV